MLSETKHLAEVSCKIPREILRVAQDDKTFGF